MLFAVARLQGRARRGGRTAWPTSASRVSSPGGAPPRLPLPAHAAPRPRPAPHAHAQPLLWHAPRALWRRPRGLARLIARETGSWPREWRGPRRQERPARPPAAEERPGRLPVGGWSSFPPPRARACGAGTLALATRVGPARPSGGAAELRAGGVMGRGSGPGAWGIGMRWPPLPP